LTHVEITENRARILQAWILTGELCAINSSYLPLVDIAVHRQYFCLLQRGSAALRALELKVPALQSASRTNPRRSAAASQPSQFTQAMQFLVLSHAQPAMHRLLHQNKTAPFPLQFVPSCGSGRSVAAVPMFLLNIWSHIEKSVLIRQQTQALLRPARSAAYPQLLLAAGPLFDGALSGWATGTENADGESTAADGTKEDFAACQRVVTIRAHLIAKGLDAKDIASHTLSPVVPRDKDGWLLPTPTASSSWLPSLLAFFSSKTSPSPLTLPDRAPSFEGGIDGIRFNVGTNAVELVGRKAGAEGPLLCNQDVKEVFGFHGVPQIHFTLDPAVGDPNSPLHNVYYLPKRLNNTLFLDTVAQCDWMLKMLTCGVEISALPPFHLRDGRHAVLQRLPSSLRDKLEELYASDRKRGARRFWIEHDEIAFDESFHGDTMVVQLSEPTLRMRVMSRTMVYDQDGSLKDSSQSEDDSDTGQKIATLLTEHYDDLAFAFPVFARLRELSRLLTLVRLFAVLVKCPPAELLEKGLGGLRDFLRKVKYPVANRSEIEQELLRANGISSKSSLHSSQYDKFDSFVASNLAKAQEMDHHHAQEVSDALRSLGRLVAAEARTLAEQCLRQRSTDPARAGLKSMYARRSTALLHTLGLDLSVDAAADLEQPLRGGGHEFMPALFRKGNGGTAAGGVALGGNVRQGTAQSISGQQTTPFKSHSGSWSKVRHDFKAQSLTDPNLPSHVRGWLQTQLAQRGSMYKARNPPGYDIDHTRNSVDHCRWQYATDNRARNGRYEAVRTRSQPPVTKK